MTNRRNFLRTALAGGLFSLLPASKAFAAESSKKLIKPPALKPGDTIGLITPASPLFEARRTLLEVEEKIHNLGFKTKAGKNIFRKYGYLAGSIEQRVDDIHQMFRDDSVKAIMTVRGGYGSAQLLPHLDYDLITHNPKILIGYSDVTSLLLGIHKMTGLVTFHGPVGVSTFSEFTIKCFMQVLTGTVPAGEIGDAPYEDNLQTSNRSWAYRPGSAQGLLTGGNMTLLQSTLGTPYEFDTKKRIIFFEEVSEEPYNLDRMLHHFKQAGKFNNCSAVFFNRMESIKPAGYKPAFNSSLSMEEVIDLVFRDFDFPVCVGLPFGHVTEKLTLPLGIKTRLEADKGRIALLEAAVV